MNDYLFRLRSAGAKALCLIALCATSASAQVLNPQRIVYQVDARTIASNGGGTPATLTLTPTRSYVAITCNDTDTCAVTMGETGIPDGMPVTIVNVSANVVTLTPASGVLEGPCPMQLQQYESYHIIYRTDRWVAVGASLTCRTITTLTDAQVKALPTTPITLIAAQGAGIRPKVLGLTVVVRAGAGAYTNVDATYSDLHLDVAAGDYIQYPILVNDSTVSASYQQMTQFLAAAADSVHDVVPHQFTALGPTGAWAGTPLYVFGTNNGSSGSTPTGLANSAVRIGADNNGSGNFTGGNAANTLKVFVYWVKETL